MKSGATFWFFFACDCIVSHLEEVGGYMPYRKCSRVLNNTTVSRVCHVLFYSNISIVYDFVFDTIFQMKDLKWKKKKKDCRWAIEWKHVSSQLHFRKTIITITTYNLTRRHAYRSTRGSCHFLYLLTNK